MDGGELMTLPPQKLYPQGFEGAPHVFAGLCVGGAGTAVGRAVGRAVGGGVGGAVGGGVGAAVGGCVGSAVAVASGTSEAGAVAVAVGVAATTLEMVRPVFGGCAVTPITTNRTTNAAVTSVTIRLAFRLQPGLFVHIRNRPAGKKSTSIATMNHVLLSHGALDTASRGRSEGGGGGNGMGAPGAGGGRGGMLLIDGLTAPATGRLLLGATSPLRSQAVFRQCARN